MSVAGSEQTACVTLWTCQHRRVLQTLRKSGVYHVKKAFITEKYGDTADIMLHAYQWYVRQARQIVPRPAGAEFPIWLSADPIYELTSPDSVLLQINAPKHLVIFFERAKWNRILNLAYIPQDENDRQDHQQMLERVGIRKEADIVLTPFYPHLRQTVIKSWQRLFEGPLEPTSTSRATLWELRPEWIVGGV